MECWNNEIKAFHTMIYQGKKWRQNQCSFGTPPQAFICPKGAIPSFQYSNIPTFQIRREAELSSNYQLTMNDEPRAMN
jgi:hypothetical protein